MASRRYGPTGRLSNIRERLRSSLWFIPTLFVVAALILASVAVWVDEFVLNGYRPWFLLGRDAPSARSMVSTVASSMFNFTGVVFSITVLVLQLTSQQFSSRVLRTFLQDRVTQIGLGVFTGTFAFALRVSLSIQQASPAKPEFVPSIGITMAFGFVLVSLVVFLVYLDHMAHSIRAISIINRIGAEGRRSIQQLYPETDWHDEEPPPPRPEGPPDAVITNDHRPGVVTGIDEDALIALACERDIVIEVVPMIGDFVPLEASTFHVWGARPPSPDEIRDLIAIGIERTPRQDARFTVRELVDIAERALSPGINDPTTAVQALDSIHDLLRTMARRPIPPPVRRDPSGRIRLLVTGPSWALFVHLGLNEIREYGTGSMQVARKLRTLLFDLREIVPAPRRAAIEEQIQLLEASIERGFKTEVEKRHARHQTDTIRAAR